MRWAWAGRVAYRDAIGAMERLAEHVLFSSEPGRALFLEHPPTVTLGRRATEKALKVSAERLLGMGISVERADRGGEATYHGPGQLVLYPVVNLRALSLGIGKYVEGLQEAARRTLGEFGITEAWGDLERPGVWTPHGKIAAIGLRVRRGIATHGMALNIDADKRHFETIVTCGMEGAQVACMSDFIAPPAVRDVSRVLARRVGEVFGMNMMEEDGTNLMTQARKEVAIA